MPFANQIWSFSTDGLSKEMVTFKVSQDRLDCISLLYFFLYLYCGVSVELTGLATIICTNYILSSKDVFVLAFGATFYMSEKIIIYCCLLPALPKVEAGLGIAFSVRPSIRTSVPARQY